MPHIERDPEFGARLARAIQEFDGTPKTVSAGHHGNAAMIVEMHHADYDVSVRVGGNRGVVVADGNAHKIGNSVTKRWIERVPPPSDYAGLATCQTKGCRKPLSYLLFSEYTLRRHSENGGWETKPGTARRRRACVAHARMFAAEYHVEMPR